MELITGRKAIDQSQDEESVSIVNWFRKIRSDKKAFSLSIDDAIEVDEGNLDSISTVAELAMHCCEREPYQRPEMAHVVNVLSSLDDKWTPTEPDSDHYILGIDP
ncbi:hypothetical protein Ddye_030316 [Dipteronia dyeriana]|uniref:Uncharacterized protein n=1 Tax=Dipteronia dyeriana TaxID=168575 RepID=A0AAD9TH67_9ROSI|nr:hypothetical protein Ddye_030316 [Dipteronia dyeriana]